MSNKYSSFNSWVKRRKLEIHRKQKKIAYATRDLAYDALEQINDETLKAYLCDICCDWHLGHNGAPNWEARYAEYRERKAST